MEDRLLARVCVAAKGCSERPRGVGNGRRAARAKTTAERLAAENAQLAARNREEAVTDALTGLRNRRALMEDIATAASKATFERPALLGLFDLDGFKQYNDTFGHAAGDALLVRLARALSAACDGRATPYRMGGDEFCLLAEACLLYTSPSPRDMRRSRMPSSA